MKVRSVFRRAVALLVVLTFVSSTLAAQGQPVLFIHGLQSEGADWASTATRLQSQFAIQAETPNLAWREPFEQQGLSLAQSVPATARNPIVVGHSNGGIVARELSRLRHVSGIATIGTPHHGAPILPRFGQWLSFQSNTSALLNDVLWAFSSWSDVSWVIGAFAGALSWISDFSIWSVVYLGTALGLNAAMPVFVDMQPGSMYLSTINSSENVQREAAEVPSRVGIASVAHNYFWAGPARAIAPDHADEIAFVLYSTAFGLLYWSSFVLATADFSDVAALNQSTTLFGLGAFLLTIDPYYCALVSGSSFGNCTPNDGVLPYTTQEYPGAPMIYVGLDNDGPAHTQEIDWSEGVLRDALSWYMHVPPRGAYDPTPSPAPVPPPEPSPNPSPTPSPDPGSDTQPAPAPTGPDTPPSNGGSTDTGGSAPRDSDPGRLWPGDYLYPGQSIHSADGRYVLAYQGDGNLVLYDENWAALWHTSTYGTTPGLVAMQDDGNLVVYDGSGTPVWASMASYGHHGAFLALQTDGNLVIYDVDKITPLWQSGTWRR